ncbi:hypothetical protein RRG08_050963 [Elysia crispata]|uniref:Uncharacterized protein n=1 Tax=Elysia crispata TaxID=231223 RepID=A0AAE1EEB0_9GAST|nr:hypothetical protein RRG08_050963 [Elysia crispata]
MYDKVYTEVELWRKKSLNDIHWFSYGQSDETNATYTSSITVDHGGEVWCRYSHNEMEAWKKVKIFKRGVTFISPPTAKYSGPVPIKTAKYQDLMKLCDKGLLNEETKQFYQALTHGNETRATDADDVDDNTVMDYDY